MWKASIVLMLLFLAACAPDAVAPSGPTADLFMSAQYSQATAEAAQKESQFLANQLTGTAVAPIVHITETAAAYQIQSQQTADAGTATAQSIEGTSTALALSIASTSTAAQTATAGSWTATALQNAAVLEAASQAAEQTAIANNVARDNLQLQRQQWTNQFNAAMPAFLILLGIVGAGILTFMLVRQQSYRPIARDARGDAIPLLNVVDGTVVDIDRSLYAQTGMKRVDLLALPAVTVADQKPVTERDQLVDLATRGLPGSDPSARKRFAVSQMATGPSLPDAQLVRVIGGDEAAGILRPILPDVAQDAMDAEIIPEDEHGRS